VACRGARVGVLRAHPDRRTPGPTVRAGRVDNAAVLLATGGCRGGRRPQRKDTSIDSAEISRKMSSTAGFFRLGGRSATPWSWIDLPLIAADDDPADDAQAALHSTAEGLVDVRLHDQ